MKNAFYGIAIAFAFLAASTSSPMGQPGSLEEAQQAITALTSVATEINTRLRFKPTVQNKMKNSILEGLAKMESSVKAIEKNEKTTRAAGGVVQQIARKLSVNDAIEALRTDNAEQVETAQNILAKAPTVKVKPQLRLDAFTRLLGFMCSDITYDGKTISEDSDKSGKREAVCLEVSGHQIPASTGEDSEYDDYNSDGYDSDGYDADSYDSDRSKYSTGAYKEQNTKIVTISGPLKNTKDTQQPIHNEPSHDTEIKEQISATQAPTSTLARRFSDIEKTQAYMKRHMRQMPDDSLASTPFRTALSSAFARNKKTIVFSALAAIACTAGIYCLYKWYKKKRSSNINDPAGNPTIERLS